MNVIERVLMERHGELRLADVGLGTRLQTALLTPRFPASRHVVALVCHPGDPSPRAVAKLPRRPRDNEGVLLEALALRELAESSGGRPVGAPALLGTVDVGRYVLLVESAVTGEELDPARVLLDRDRAVRAGTAFIDALPVVTAAEDNAGWYDRAVTCPLEEIARHVPLDGETGQLVDRTHAVLAPLREAVVPAVFEHGDLSHPNLFLGPDGALQVVDWERSVRAGVPGHDLVFFLQYIAEASRSAVDRPDQLTAYDEDVLAADGWARPLLIEHLTRRGVDARLLEPLLVCSWARTAAGLMGRLLPGDAPRDEDPPSPAGLDAALRQSRDFELWRHAVARAEGAPS